VLEGGVATAEKMGGCGGVGGNGKKKENEVDLYEVVDGAEQHGCSH